MKVCKVTITKSRNLDDTECQFTYPSGYTSDIMSPFIYQNEGLETEYCLAIVPNGFPFTDDMVEITNAEAETIIDNWVDNDRDLQAAVADPDNDFTSTDLENVKTTKKSWIPSA